MARRKRKRERPPDPFNPFDTVTEELDLHGYTRAEARDAVGRFLRTWSSRGRGITVRVITGRGKGSAKGPVLFGMVRRMLEGECAALIDRWERDDSDGGFLVRLR